MNETEKDIVILPVEMAARVNKLFRKRKVSAADRREVNEIVWMLKMMAETHQAHSCPMPVDYGEEYMRKALRTENTRAFVIGADGKPDMKLSLLLHAAMGMVTEASEVLDALKKSIVYGKPVDYVNLLEEAGDEKWYLALLLRTLEKTDRQAGDLNIQKLLVRYPDKFSGERAMERDLVKERAVYDGAFVADVGSQLKAPTPKILPHQFREGVSGDYCEHCNRSLQDADPGFCPSR